MVSLPRLAPAGLAQQLGVGVSYVQRIAAAACIVMRS
jgi:hypothetical protein